MTGDTLERFLHLIEQPHGIILVTGPTGSGKTTTLYAALSRLDASTSNIMTVEDPIEYELPGIGQTQVNPKIDLDFAKALRAILRQDPDVIMIGEIRDYETAQIAIQASLTGHLVLATLHTQSAAQTIDRLIDIFPPHQQDQVRAQLSNCLQGVVTQALVPTPDGNGRTAVCEIMIATPAIRNLVREGKVHQIPTFIQSSSDVGMISFDQHLALRFDQRLVSRTTALEVAHDPDEFLRIARLQG
jgi:twitching motility protein PilT